MKNCKCIETVFCIFCKKYTLHSYRETVVGRMSKCLICDTRWLIIYKDILWKYQSKGGGSILR